MEKKNQRRAKSFAKVAVRAIIVKALGWGLLRVDLQAQWKVPWGILYFYSQFVLCPPSIFFLLLPIFCEVNFHFFGQVVSFLSLSLCLFLRLILCSFRLFQLQHCCVQVFGVFRFFFNPWGVFTNFFPRLLPPSSLLLSLFLNLSPTLFLSLSRLVHSLSLVSIFSCRTLLELLFFYLSWLYCCGAFNIFSPVIFNFLLFSLSSLSTFLALFLFKVHNSYYAFEFFFLV